MAKAIFEFDDLSERLQTIEDLLRNVQPEASDKWVDNEELCNLLSISNKTAQSYRDKGLITFSQIGNKIYYRISSINEFLDSHKRKAFKAHNKL